MGDTLLEEIDARKLIGCDEGKVQEWIEEGKIWAISIATEEARRPCYRISKVSVLEMQKVCRKGVVTGQKRKPVQKSVDS